MIIDTATQLSEAIKKEIEKELSYLPVSYPCKVTSVDDSGVYVEVDSLLVKDENSIPVKIPIMQSPYIKAPIKEGDIGIALNCSFLFDLLIEDKEIEENQRALQENALFFIPFVSKENQKEEINKLTLLSQDKKNKIILDDDKLIVSVGGKNSLSADKSTLKTDLPIEQNTSGINIKSNSGGLYEAFDAMISLMDLLAECIQGSASNNAPYKSGKTPFIQQVKKVIKS